MDSMIFVLTWSTPGDHWREKSDNGKSMDGQTDGRRRRRRARTRALRLCVAAAVHIRGCVVDTVQHTGVDSDSALDHFQVELDPFGV